MAGDEATVVEMSWYGDRTVPLELGAAFHARRLSIVSSQVGRIAAGAARAVGLSPAHAAGPDLLREPVLDVLISGESASNRCRN